MSAKIVYDTSFRFVLLRSDGAILRSQIPEDNHSMLYMDFLNTFCGLSPAEWIDKTSHNKRVILTTEVNEKIHHICNKHIASKPDIKNIIDFFNAIEIGDSFVFLRDGTFMKIDQQLINHSFEVLNSAYIDRIYNVTSYGDKKVNIGHINYKDSVCRFCGKKYPEARFLKDNAHAIPEALGNKLLFCNDECTKCNHDLAPVENNLTHYLNVRRASAQIRGKHKIPTITGHNFILDGKTLNLKITKYAILEETDDQYFLKLEGAEPITHLGIYQALIKIAIDLVDEPIYEQIKPVVKWVNGSMSPKTVPNVWYMYRNEIIKQPKISIYTRKDGFSCDYGPLCVIRLDIVDLSFLYIIPFAKSDKGRYLTSEQCWPTITRYISLVGHYSYEYIDMTDRIGKFAHVKQWIKKTDCEIIAHEDLLNAQEHPKNKVEFPPLNEDDICIHGVFINETYRSLDINLLSVVTMDTSAIHCEITNSLDPDRKISISCKLSIAQIETQIKILELQSVITVTVAHLDKVISIEEQEMSGQFVEYVLSAMSNKMKLIYGLIMPHFIFDDLPRYLMELEGIITHPNESAEKSVIPKDKTN